MKLRLTLGGAALMVLAGCTTVTTVTGPAAFESGGRYTVGSGEKTTLGGSFLTLDPDTCASKTPPTGTIITQPKHGSVGKIIARSHAQFPRGPMRHCHNKIGNALTFQYTSTSGYRGPDSFTVRIRFNDGEIRHQTYRIQVR